MRYDAESFNLENLGLHAGDAASELTVSRRDYSDPEKLQRLYSLGIALQEWATRFDSELVTEMASGSMDGLSLQRLLLYVKEQVATCAPEAAVPDAASRSADHAAMELDGAVFLAMQLPAYIKENFNQRWEPVGMFPDGEVPADARCEAEWEPPDNPPAASVRNVVKEPVAAAVSPITWWNNLEQRTDRVGRLASAAVQNLIAQINSDEEGGFFRGRVEDFVRSLSDQSVERRVHDGFMQTLDALARLAGRKDAGQWMDWEELTRELDGRYGEWSDKCFAPTVPLATGRNQHTVRSTRKSKKDALRRLVANVSQYGPLLRGAVETLRVSMAIKGLSVMGQRLQLRVRKLHGAVMPLNRSDVDRDMRLLDQQAVNASTLEKWKQCLGPRGKACGQLVERISRGDLQQVEPWEPKQYAAQLKTAAIFGSRNPDKEFQEIRLRMQAAGIAIQAPWKYIEGKRAQPETKDGIADKWLLNPMAQILAPESD